jgi:hypothetical protein
VLAGVDHGGLHAAPPVLVFRVEDRRLMNAARAAGSRAVENFSRAVAGALTTPPPEPSPLPPGLLPPSSLLTGL